jgi:DNA-binding NarL/FixJ family response regulator
MILIGLAALALVVYLMKKGLRGGARRGEPRLSASDLDSRRIRDDMEKLLAELDQLSARMNRQLDEKHSLLQDAIKDADQRIFALRTLVQSTRGGKTSSSEGAQAPHAQPTGQPRRSSMHGPSAPSQGGTVSDDLDPRMRRIYQLADQGMAAQEIAQRLKDHVGEVELILHLRQMAQRQAL